MISRICIGFALLAASGLASTGTAPKSSGIPSDTIQPFELQPFLVPAHPVLEGGVLAPILSAGIPETPESAIRAFETTPGLSIGSRGPSSKEPNIRGLSFDRVLTTWNGLPLPNAAPTRTGSPINTSSLLAGSTMDIHLTGNDLISGPGVSGGRIVFETPAGLQSGIEHSLAHLSFASNPLGISVAARSGWESGPLHGTTTLTHSRQGDYSSGDGNKIPSTLQEEGINATLGLTHGNTTHSLSLLWHKTGEGENPALPQDTVSNEITAVTTVHRLPVGTSGGLLRLRSGWAKSMPRLSNSPRAIRTALVDASSNARSLHGDLLHTLPLGDAVLIRTAIDLDFQRRNAIRIRNRTLHDIIWPDIVSNRQGIGIAIDRHAFDSAWHIQTQFRIDQHTDEARSTHRHTLGKPVHEWYTAYAGAKDPETRVTHTLPSLSFQTAWRPSLRPWAIHAAVAATSQNPTPTERFRAMLPALGGGYEIGNPNLDPEAQVRGEVAFHLESRRGFIHFTAWHSRFDSFIQRHAIGPYQSAPLFSFRNVDARLSGIEWASSFDLLTHRRRLSDGYPRLDLPLAISWTTGDFLDPDGAWTSLAEIPPLRIRTGIEHSFAYDQRRFRLAAYATWEASRSNPDPNLFPTLSDSGDHLTFDIEAKIWAASTWSVELQVRNVGDLEYARHLSPRPSIPLANGSPLPSDKAIPDPGRSFLLSLSKSF